MLRRETRWDRSAANQPLWGKRFPALDTVALLLVSLASFFLHCLEWESLRTALCLSTLMFSFYFCEVSMGTWRVMHVLKGIHICCALGAGRQHCYCGPNLIFSLFWSSTFNHWLLGGLTFSKKLFESQKKMLLQHVYGVIHVKREVAHKKNAAYLKLYRQEWIAEFGVKTAA